MGSLGTSLKQNITNIINTGNFRGTIVIKQLAKNAGNYGGYQAVADTETSVTTYGIPVDYIKKVDLSIYGALQHGSLNIVISATETINEEVYDYVAVWQNTNWQVKSVNRPVVNDTIICIILELVKNQ